MPGTEMTALAEEECPLGEGLLPLVQVHTVPDAPSRGSSRRGAIGSGQEWGGHPCNDPFLVESNGHVLDIISHVLLGHPGPSPRLPLP